jgi:hypothetical protein
LFAFSQAKQAYYFGSSLIWLDTAPDAQRAWDQALRAIVLWQTGDPADRSQDDEALACVYAATAALQLRNLEAAVHILEPILGLPEDRRISWIRKRLLRISDLLAAPPYQREPLAVETRERIAAYV